MSASISADFPYKSCYAKIGKNKMHYITQGEGDTVLFLHGIPTWSYLWRNIIPHLSEHAHCVAPDMMGMGRSAKLSRHDYRVFDHIEYLSRFIEQLNLQRITLVMHGWGSVIGFAYAMHHPDNIKGLAFLESHIRPTVQWDMVSLPVQQELTALLASADGGYDEIIHNNYFIERFLPDAMLRHLSEQEMNYYREPFADAKSRHVLWQYFQELPLGIDGEGEQESDAVVALIEQYSQFLRLSSLPKLMMYNVPGFITTMDTVSWAKDNLPQLQLADVGEGLHYVQEANPTAMGEALADWYGKLG